MSSFSISPAVSGKSTWNLQSDGPLDLSTSGTWTIVPTVNIDVGAKVWGAGGGLCYNNGGGGGAATGNITLVSGTSYQLIVGSGGAGTASPNRNGAGGGAGSGIQFTTGTVAILVAGGGGGGEGSGLGGAGGGTTGQAGSSASIQGPGQGGTQSAPGAGGAGGRRTGASGSGRNGGNGAGSGGVSLSGGTGFGNGGGGALDGGDAGGGGGGGGYFGGGGGGGNESGGSGGGGSGFINTSVVTGGNLYTGNYEVPGLNSDANRGTAGNGGQTGSVTGISGKIYLSLNIPPDGFNNVPTSVTSGTTITVNLGSTANSTATPPGTVSYTITGISSADLMNTPLTGNMTLAGYTYTLSIPTRIKASTTNTLTISAAGYTTSVTINPGLIVRYLIVAGGGGGGSDMGGGGGAGGYLAGTNLLVTPGSKTITIGAGGSGAPAGTSGPRGTNGQDTTALGFTSIGGGGGASKHDANSFPAGNGGSGGGGSGARQSNGNYGGLAGTGTPGQGFDGANSGVTWYPGGGGGSGAAASQTGSQVAHGGIGTQNDITGTNLYWAAGGGGAGYSVFGGNGGLGGGGGGAPRQSGGTGNGGGSALNAGADAEIGTTVAQTNKRGGAAGVNTGSGGGGGAHYNLTNDGGNGGSGIVVIRYQGTQKATGGTITTVGTDTVHTFLTSGTFFAYTPGLSASQSTAFWGDSITFTSYTDDADGTNLAYTITGVTSSEINNAATSGNITVTSSVATLTVQLSNLNYTNITTMVVTVGTSSISIPVTYVTSLVASGTGMSWGLSRTITVSTRGLANASNIAYSMTGATTAQLAGGALSGNIQVVETPQFTSQGQYSVFFDGTGDYLTASDNSAFDLSGSISWCIELWAFWSSVTGEQNLVEKFTHNSGPGWTLYKFAPGTNSGTIDIYGSSGSFNSGFTPVAGVWYHIAVCRDNSAGRTSFFINGSRTATSTTFSIASNASKSLLIGARDGGITSMNGYISNLRIVKGSTVYDPAQTTITIPTSGLSVISNTSLLTCRSSTFRDLSTNNFTITKVGDAAVNVLNPVPTTFSNFFDGTGDYLSIASGMDVGTSDFTIEAWVYPTAWTVEWNSIFSTRASASTAGATDVWVLGVHNTGYAYIYSGAMQITGSAGQIILNAWTHLTVARQGSSMRLFVNGSLITTTTSSQNYTQSAGSIGANRNGSEQWTGFISNLRLIAGTALYTSSFTIPSTPLTNVANTRLLTCQSNGLRDNSTNNFTITRNGDVAIRSFNPVEFTYSNYFVDASGDYLQIDANGQTALQSNNFTIEFWIYLTQATANNLQCFYSNYTTWGANAIYFGKHSSVNSGAVGVYIGNYSTSSPLLAESTLPPANVWTHYALVRNGNVFTLYRNGVATSTSSLFTGSATGATNPNYIAINGDGGHPSVSGYISNFRIVNGTAVYTQAFTPPTSNLTAIANTALLTCASSRFRDLSTNNFTINRFGDVRIDPLIPDISFVPTTTAPIGTAVLTINTNASEPILNQATLVVTISGTTRTFLIKTLGPGNILERLNTTVSTIEFIDTEITDVHTANIEGKVLTSANFTAILNNAGFNTTVTTIEFIDTEVTDVHSANLEGKVLTQSTFNAEYEESTYKTTHGNVVYAATYAHTTGTDVRISGGGTAGSNQRWSI